MRLHSGRNSEIRQILPEFVLGCQTGIAQVSALFFPFFQTAVVEEFEIIINNKRHNSVSQAFFKQKQPADSAVSVLERMNTLEPVMKVQKVVKAFDRDGIV